MTHQLARRNLLRCAAWLGVTCGCAVESSQPSSGQTSCTRDTPSDPSAWVRIPWESLHRLREDGFAVVDVDDAWLHVFVVYLGNECYTAVWRICSHGACELNFSPSLAQLVCPCHGSRFDLHGEVLQGPAIRPLRVLPTFQDDDSLWIRKPT